MRRTLLALLVTVLLVSLSATASTVVYPLGMSSTSSFSNGGFPGQTPRGYDFSISRPITVVQLGVNAGDSIDITMSLWDVTTRTLLGQTVVTSSSFAWTFANLGSPIHLVPGDIFSVIG